MTNLIAGQVAFFDILGAQDDGGVNRPATFAVKVADYTLGYVALSGGTRVYFVPKLVGATSITISSKNQSGGSLPDITMDFTTADLPSPQATHLVLSGLTVAAADITTPIDPGNDTVTGSL